MSDVNEITRSISSGQGDLGKLINDDTITDQLSGIMANLQAMSTKADSVMDDFHQATYALNHGEGVLPRLLHDKELGLSVDTAITRVDQGVFEVTRAAETISNKKKSDDAPQSAVVTKQPVSFEVQPGDTVIVPVNEAAGLEIRRKLN